MIKNYMEDVAKMLGIELDEEFMIENADGHLIDAGFYRLTKVGCYYRTCDSSKMNGIGDGKFLGILQGQFKIRKLPWQPDAGDEYYYPSFDLKRVSYSRWNNETFDFAYKEAGFIFKTYEECEASLATLREKYLGGNDNE